MAVGNEYVNNSKDSMHVVLFMYLVDWLIGWVLFMVGLAIREQSRRINQILRNVNAAVMNHSSKAVDMGEKVIREYGYYRYNSPWTSDTS
jgi:hypothetical protein